MATTEELEAKVRAEWPQFTYLLSEPELRTLLLDAVDPDKGFSADEFQARFQATNWYRTHSDATRSWEALSNADPASAERQLQQLTTDMQQIGAEIGLPSGTNYRHFAWFSLQGGLSATEQRRLLAGQVRLTEPDAPAGDMGQTMDEIRRMARSEFLVPLSEQDVLTWAKTVVMGDMTMDSVKANLAGLSKGRFGHLSSQIDQGLTPGAYFAPYRQLIADEMEVGSDAVDLLDPQYADILSKADGDKVRAMTLSEAQKYVRTKPEWEKTSRAKGMAAQLGNELLRTFGALA